MWDFTKPLLGCDISHHQPTANVAALKAAGITFVICKASEGTTFVDPNWKANRSALAAAGFLVGAYHFLDPGNGAAQADHFWEQVKDQGALLYFLDVEKAPSGNPTYDDVVTFRARFAQLAPGSRLIVYTAKWYWTGVLGNPDGPAIGPLWDASWIDGKDTPANLLKVLDHPHFVPYAGWTVETRPLQQFSSSAVIPGYASVDADVFFGTRDELVAIGTINTGRDVMPTRADIVVKWLLGMVGFDYQMGEESYGLKVGTPATADPNDVDCSGVGYSGVTMANRELKQLGLAQVLWKNGEAWPRLTANGYRAAGVKVTDGSLRVLDYFCFSDSSGHTYHISWYAGADRFLDKDDVNEEIVEARGEKYGVKKYTVDYLISRGAVHYRFPWIGDLGPVTGAPQPAHSMLSKGMSGAGVKEAQLRLNVHMGPMLSGTGFFGDVTVDVTKWFQALKDLEIDGIIGTEETWPALLAAPVFPTLTKGMKKAYVGLMKYWMNKKGAKLTTTNWFFGDATDAALRKIQAAAGITETGCGPKTWAYLIGAK